MATIKHTAQLARIEHKLDVIDSRTAYLSRVVNNVQNASDAIWGNTRPMMPWYLSAPTALLITLTIINPLRTAGTPVSPAIDGAYTYTRYAGEAVGAWMAAIQFAQPNMAVGQAIRGLTNAQTIDLMKVIRQRENSGSYAGWNKWGALGGYQAMAQALVQTGFIKKEAYEAADECLNGHVTCGKKHLEFLKNDDNWMAGYSFSAFIDTPRMQDKFFISLANFHVSEGFRRGVLRADKPQRIAGFVAISHLQGVGAARDYYLHGNDSKIGGAFASEYARLGESAVSSDAMTIASQYIGLHEQQDTKELARLVGFDPRGRQNAWCAGFVNAVLKQSGSTGTSKLNARSFLDWGYETRQPKRGDIVVLWRGSRDAWTGHVGFYSGVDAAGNVLILGGNQDNQVSVEAFDKNRVLSFRSQSNRI